MKRTLSWIVFSTLFTLLLIQVGGVGRINAFATRHNATDSEHSQATKPAPQAEPEVEFERREEMIPMRDGARLHTLIFAPKNQTDSLPIIMNRTPYGISQTTSS